MATYNQERIIKEYWEKVKHLYPTVPFDKFSEACKYPAIFIKNVIKSGTLKTIMVKWMGKFIVYPARLKRELNRKEIFFSKGIIPEENLLDYREKYEVFMEKYKEESPGFILIDKKPEMPIASLPQHPNAVVKDFTWEIPNEMKGKMPLIVGTAGELDCKDEDLNNIFYGISKDDTDRTETT